MMRDFSEAYPLQHSKFKIQTFILKDISKEFRRENYCKRDSNG